MTVKSIQATPEEGEKALQYSHKDEKQFDTIELDDVHLLSSEQISIDLSVDSATGFDSTEDITDMSQKEASGKLQESEQDSPTPPTRPDGLPMGVLLIVYAVIASDAVALNITTPFLTDLCRDRFGISQAQLGLAVGALTGTFSFAVFFSSFAIGQLSDKYGRKALMLMGIASGTVCTLLFGIVPYFWMAILLRFIAGVTNGNLALCKAVISDITDNAEHRALAFGYQAGAFSAARVLASSVGGLTTGIEFPVPGNPFLFPCAVGALFQAATLVMTWVFIPETIAFRKAKPRPGAAGYAPLQEGAPSPPARSWWDAVVVDMAVGAREAANDGLLRKMFALNSLNSFGNGGVLVLMMLIITYPLDGHGLGYSPQSVGLFFGMFGALSFVFQVMCYKRIHHAVGLVGTYYIGTTLLCVTTAIFPLTSLFYWLGYHGDGSDGGPSTTFTVLTSTCVAVLMAVSSLGFMTCLPVTGAMLSNVADDARQGLVQGLAQSMSSLFRALGPLIAGALFSAFSTLSFYWPSFWFLACVYLTCFFVTFFLTPEERARACNTPVGFIELKELDKEGLSDEESSR